MLQVRSVSEAIQKSAASVLALGSRLGEAFGHFLLWLGQTGAEAGHSRVFFLSREGAWLAQRYSALRAIHPDGSRWPEARVLAVSRRSTLLAHMDEVDSQALSGFVQQYRQASVANVLESLGIAPETAEMPPETLWSAPGISAAVLSHQRVRAALEDRRIQQRSNLLRYLAQEGFAGQSRAMVADVGWRGTIQDHLCRLLPQQRIDGAYLAQFPPFAPPPGNASKQGFMLTPDDAAAELRRLRFVAPFEFICSDNTRSVRGYCDANGTVAPEFDDLEVVDTNDPALVTLQDAILVGILRQNHLQSPDTCVTRGILVEMIESPHPALVSLYFGAWRDDRYGAGTLSRDAPRLSPGMALRALVGRSGRQDFGRALASSGWPWALLQRDLPLALPLLRKLILATDARL